MKFRLRWKNLGVEGKMAAEAAVLALPSWGLVVIGLILIVVAIAIIFALKNLLANSILGIAALLVINYYGTASGINIPINLMTVLISGLLGLAGAGLILVLYFLGIKIY